MRTEATLPKEAIVEPLKKAVRERTAAKSPVFLKIWRRERDSNPRYPCGYSGFQDHRHRPLGHPSARLFYSGIRRMTRRLITAVVRGLSSATGAFLKVMTLGSVGCVRRSRRGLETDGTRRMNGSNFSTRLGDTSASPTRRPAPSMGARPQIAGRGERDLHASDHGRRLMPSCRLVGPSGVL